MAKVVTFGELLLRLSPNGYYRFFQNDQLQATFGGSEANAAVSLANFGLDSVFVTRLPEHAIGQAAVNNLRGFGVDTERIVRGGDRVGIYFLEKGASQRSSVCIYDRQFSSFQQALPTDFVWDDILRDADWLHFSGITPALGDNTAEICWEACRTAKQRGIPVSCDTNYRSGLWTAEKAGAVMTELMAYVDVCITNPGDARDLFGIASDRADFSLTHPDRDGCRSVAEKLRDRFAFSYVALTLRTSRSASDNDWSAVLYDGNNFCFSRTYPLHIVDRVGGGDSFSGALIYALLTGKEDGEAIEFAAAAAALKHSIEGDYNRVTVSEVERLAAGDGSGRVRR